MGPRDRPVAASLGETRAVMVEGESAAPRPTTAEGETWLFVSPREGMRIHDLSAGRDARHAGMACAGYPAATGGRVGGRYGSAYAIAATVAALQQAGIFAEG